MKRVYIFGAGQTGLKIYNKIKKDKIILGFLDNNELKHGSYIEEIPVLGDAKYLKNKDFDEVIIGSLPGYRIMNQELIKIGISPEKIDSSFVMYPVKAREQFLFDYASLWKDREAAVAEGGVFQGEFARKINSSFPNDSLYLFDTFSGFDERDLIVEYENQYSNEILGHFKTTTVSLVLKKCEFPEKVIIKKGYFPQTTENLEKEKFKFVNLDFDLFEPTLAGLKFFYPKMLTGSVILIHDYFNEGYKGIKEAVEVYKKIERNLITMPIGDNYSIAIIKR